MSSFYTEFHYCLGQGATLTVFCRKAFRRRKITACAECWGVVAFSAWQQKSINQIHWVFVDSTPCTTHEWRHAVKLRLFHHFQITFLEKYCISSALIPSMLRDRLLGLSVLSWDIRVHNALVLLPSSRKLILAPVESLGLDEVHTRYLPPPIFLYIRLISHAPAHHPSSSHFLYVSHLLHMVPLGWSVYWQWESPPGTVVLALDLLLCYSVCISALEPTTAQSSAEV